MSDPTKPRIFAVIFVRGGSKGVPRKNLRRIGGRTLLGHSIAVAQACPRIDRIVVSTEDAELAQEALRCGAEVPFVRPPELAQDNSPEWAAWQHAIAALKSDASFGEFDCIISLPATTPLRSAKDVDACLDMLLNSDADIVVSVTPAVRHPSFNMVRLDEGGLASIYLPVGHEITHRQDAPAAWDITTVAFAARPDWVLRTENMWDGKVRAVVVPPERAIDIDTELDLAFVDFLLQSKQAPDENVSRTE